MEGNNEKRERKQQIKGNSNNNISKESVGSERE
jgi:hypothetical protein